MKKRKFNILLNIAVLCMCVCAIAIGVYSAKTASLNVSGTIGFTAHNCEIAIKGEMNAYEKVNDSTNRAVTKYFNSTNAEGGTAKTITGSNNVWDIGTVCFDDLNTDKYHEVNDIVFTFTITNESAYYVDVTVNQKCINDNRIFIYAPNNGETLAPKGQDGSSVTLTVKFQLKASNGEYTSLDSAINLSNATLLNFTKSQAPSYLATNWKDKIKASNTSAFSSAKKISFVNKINDTILNGFDKDGENYKTVSVGAVNETSNAGNLTTSVTDAVAYYNSTNKEIIIYSPARIYAPQLCRFMFNNCEALTSLDLSNFDTSKVTEMICMFSSCSALTSLDVSNFDTSNVTDMSYMFQSCEALTSLDVSNFDTSKAKDMSGMFTICRALTSLDVSNFNTSSVTNMSDMFSSCWGLTSIDVRNFDTSKVEYMSHMFSECTKLTSLDVSNFDTSKVTSMWYMFYGCCVPTSLDVSNFNTSKVTDMSSMFSSCSGLTSLDVSKFDTSKVTDMSSMFKSCSGLTSLDVSNFKTSSVTNMSEMFYSCSGLTSLDLSKFDTSKVTDMSSMFYSCSGLTSLDVSKFDTSSVTSMNWMFVSCSALTSLDLSNFNTSSVTSMYYMFKSCGILATIYVGANWNTTNVTSSGSMFYDCTKLVGGAGTTYNSNKTDKTYAKVDGGTSNPGYLTEK